VAEALAFCADAMIPELRYIPTQRAPARPTRRNFELRLERRFFILKVPL